MQDVCVILRTSLSNSGDRWLQPMLIDRKGHSLSGIPMALCHHTAGLTGLKTVTIHSHSCVIT